MNPSILPLLVQPVPRQSQLTGLHRTDKSRAHDPMSPETEGADLRRTHPAHVRYHKPHLDLRPFEKTTHQHRALVLRNRCHGWLELFHSSVTAKAPRAVVLLQEHRTHPALRYDCLGLTFERGWLSRCIGRERWDGFLACHLTQPTIRLTMRECRTTQTAWPEVERELG